MSVNIKDNIMTPDLQRTYEISLWTLQDGFIAVLGDSSSQTKGYIENPTMSLSNDGTQELDFSLPMYIDDGITRKKSHIWSQMTNAVTIAGMRKIKVIFNKNTKDQAIYEFIITKVTDSHDQNRPMCAIHCEGLAFHELGKIGYKIELSLDNFYLDQEAEYDKIKAAQEATQGEQEESEYELIEQQIELNMQPTIDYWNEKIGLTKYPDDENETILSSIWYYRVQMDWSAFEQGYLRKKDKIYEESYISEYDDDLNPKEYVQFAEKARFVEASNSNIYNLTQEIAKTFGVYCKYEYIHDDNYHIIGRIVTYYNNFIDERRRLEFTYPYTSKSITRENDCTDLVTKMYVNTVESSQSSTGLITIMDNPVNPTGEDYLLNFDYLYSIGTITNDQYDYIKEFSKKIKQLNNNIIQQQNIVIKRQTVEITYNAELEVLENSLEEELEQITKYQEYYDDLIEQSEGTAGISRTDNLRLELFIIDYNVTFPDEGVISGTIKLYDANNKVIPVKTTVTLDEIDPSTGQHKELTIVVWEPIKDETSKYISGVKFIKQNEKYYSKIYNVSSAIKVEYTYYPQLYYSDVIDLFTEKYNLDTIKRNNLLNKIRILEAELEEASQQSTDYTEEKQALLKEFERIMGPALREGNWTPEEYTHTANAKYQLLSQLITTNPVTVWPLNSTEMIIQQSALGPTAKLIWDTELEYNEVDNKYLTMSGQYEYYYILPLTNTSYINTIVSYYENNNNNGSPFGLIWWNDSNNNIYPTPLIKFLSFGSGCECAFLSFTNSNNQIEIIPALILTGLTVGKIDESDTYTVLQSLNNMSTGLYLGSVAPVEVTENNTTTYKLSLYNAIKLSSGNGQITAHPIITTAEREHYKVCQLRLRVNDYTLLTDEQNLKISYQVKTTSGTTKTISFSEYEDYSVGQIVHTNTMSDDNGYDITFKPVSIIKRWNTMNSIYVIYACSQLSTAVYLDAVQVLKENAYPKVTYSVDPNLMYKDFFYTDYQALNKIAFINDNELEFNQVQGYISSISLNLDKPWEDTVEVKNYKNKFEDIFSTIVAQTETMERTEVTINNVGNTINTSGTLSEASLQNTISKMTLTYVLSDGTQTIDKKNGILVSNGSKAVSIKPVGVFFASGMNSAGEYIWNEAISSKGINASAISYGKLSLNSFVLKGVNTEFNTDDGLISKDWDSNLSYDNGHIIINSGTFTSNKLNTTTEEVEGETVTTISVEKSLIINQGKLTSNVLTIDNGTLILLDNQNPNVQYNAIQLIPATLSTPAQLVVNNKNNLIINNMNIEDYIKSSISSSWGSSSHHYIPISNINISNSNMQWAVRIAENTFRLGIPDTYTSLYFDYNSSNRTMRFTLGTVANPIFSNTVVFNNDWTSTATTTFGQWNVSNGDSLFKKDNNNNIISQIAPDAFKIDDYIKTDTINGSHCIRIKKLYLIKGDDDNYHTLYFINTGGENNYRIQIRSDRVLVNFGDDVNRRIVFRDELSEYVSEILRSYNLIQ